LASCKKSAGQNTALTDCVQSTGVITISASYMTPIKSSTKRIFF